MWRRRPITGAPGNNQLAGEAFRAITDQVGCGKAGRLSAPVGAADGGALALIGDRIEGQAS